MRRSFRFFHFVFPLTHDRRTARSQFQGTKGPEQAPLSKSNRRRNKDGQSGRSRLKGRPLRLEGLEDRRLLSVTAAEYEEIRASFAEFGLPADMNDINLIEVTATDSALRLSDLASAVASASASPQNDLIVVRTTESAHTIRYAQASDELIVNIDSAAYGSLTVVGYGEKILTLDANDLCRVMTVSNGTLGVGNVAFVRGAASGYGGGLYNSGKTTLVDAVISGNATTGYYSSGGGICNSRIGDLSLVRSLIEGNSVSGSYASLGGGVCNEYGILTMTGCEVRGNVVNGPSYNLGGGVCNDFGVMTLTDCVVHGNTVAPTNFYSLGGGVCNGGDAEMTGCLVYANSATHGGGVGSQKILIMTGSTITGNSAVNGGGLWAYGESGEQYTIHLYNVILAGNTAENGTDYLRYNRYITVNAFHTLSSFTAWANAADAVNYLFDAAAPLFTDAAENDFTLADGSQAIDKGCDDYVTVAADLAGNRRICGLRVDLGAYEFQAASPVDPLAAPTNVAVVSGGANRHKVTWDAVENAVGYQLEYSADGALWTSVDTADVSFTVTDLTYGSVMTYRVTALGDGVSFADSDASAAKSLAVCPMDVNGDGLISATDRNFVSSAWFTQKESAGWDVRCDINGDGLINASDRNWLSSNWGKRTNAADLAYPAPRAAAAFAGLADGANGAAEGIGVSVLPTEDAPLSETAFSTAAVTDMDVLNLNSKSDSAYFIYLDFDGHVTSGTRWNEVYTQGADIVTPRFTMDGDAAKMSFTVEESAAIYNIWLRVAEDYMPFDVNVTTCEPDAEAFTSGQAVRMAIGGSYVDWYGAAAGGISYIGDFVWKSDTPGFVFSEDLYHDIKYIAETISHESGHSLGLYHDGSTVVEGQDEYYEGTDGWAPIMGASYYEELTQWCLGEYYGANNKNDELDIITTRNGFGYRSDDGGDGFADARTLTLTNGTGLLSGIIERNTDVDRVVFESDGSALDFWIGGIKGITNLDVLVSVYDSSLTEIAVYNPTDRLDVEFTFAETAGTYYLTVEGTGKETSWAGIYSDYGSLGAYDIAVGFPTVLTVTTLTDSIENDGCLSLREALLAATERTSIVFDSSLAGGTVLLTQGVLTVERGVQIDASGIGGITIDAAGTSPILTTAGNVVLHSLTLTGGEGVTKGAAIYNTGELTLINSVLSGNTAAQRSEYLVGGALYNAAGAAVTVIGSTFTGNIGNYGGAIFNAGTITLTESLVENNRSWSYHAGGIYNTGTLTVADSVFTGNESIDKSGYTVGGGAIYNDAGAALTVTGTSLTDNRATLGGAIFNLGTCVLDDLLLSENVIWSNKGGAIFNSGSLSVTDSVFAGNRTAEDGRLLVGGGALWNAAAGTATVTQSLFYGNRGDLGGAVFNSGEITLTNATVVGNTATNSYGGGLFNIDGGTLTVNNSIIAENISSTGLFADVSPYGGIVTGSNNLSSFTDWTDGTGNLSYSIEKPLFTDLAENDFTLADGSQAIDVGEDAAALNPDGSAIEFDLAGNRRICGLRVDLGAYEFQTASPIDPLAAPTILSVVSAGANRHKVTWDAVENAVGYQLEYSADGALWTSVAVTDLFYTATGLTYGTAMTYRVTALGDGVSFADSAASATKSLTVCPIDIDGDGFVGPGDWSWLSVAWFSRPSEASWDLRADIDGDGFVGPTDVNYLATNWFKFSTEEDFFFPPAPSAASAVIDAVFDDAFESVWENDELVFFG